MRILNDRERRTIVDDLYEESEDDLVGLWEVAKLVEELVGTGEEAREQSLTIVNDLLVKGLVVGDPPYAPGGYKVWDDQDPKRVVGKIRAEWISLGHTPNIPDIAWFARRV